MEVQVTATRSVCLWMLGILLLTALVIAVVIHLALLILEGKRPMKKGLWMVVAGAVMLGASIAHAQSANSYLLPYGMSTGMQLLNRSFQPRPPVAAPTPAAPVTAYSVQAGEAYGMQAGDRRLVREQWTGQRWVVLYIPAKQCNPRASRASASSAECGSWTQSSTLRAATSADGTTVIG